MESSGKFSEEEAKIYDRQIRLWGIETQQRLRNAHVLIGGEFKGLGAEICKNLVLAGVSVTIQDEGHVVQQDFESQFFLSKESLGKNRAKASEDGIKLLNPQVKVNIETSNLKDLFKIPGFLKKFTVVCIVGSYSLNDLIGFNHACRSESVPFMASSVAGLVGFLFQDLLSNYTYSLKPKEEEEKNQQQSSKETPTATANGNVIIQNNDNEDEDLVMIEEEEKGEKVKRDAVITQAKLKFTVPYSSLDESLRMTWKSINAKKRKRGPPFLPEIFYALRVENELLGEPQKSNNIHETLEKVFKHEEIESPDSFYDRDLICRLVSLREKKVELSPVCAILGGIVCQEIQKVISRFDRPFDNWFFFDGQDDDVSLNITGNRGAGFERKIG